MRFAVFGLTITSSWGNGHATLWRGLLRALARRGHTVTFYERDVPYYAAHRDLHDLSGVELVLYPDWGEAMPLAKATLGEADVAIVTSYCPDAIEAGELVTGSASTRREAFLRVFYDLDAPVTLNRAREGLAIDYLGPRGLEDYDLVLSYAGGGALAGLAERFGARHVEPLYGSVDPEIHRPVSPAPEYRCDLSYLGTYAADRHDRFEDLFLVPARRRPGRAFLLGGSGYPDSMVWPGNLRQVRHVAPPDHARFYCSSRLTLNLTRGPMLETGYCPSGRLFEAAACGTPMVTDLWDGIGRFFEPGSEVFVARSPEEVIRAIETLPEESLAVGLAARERVLREHTADHRAAELIAIVEDARARSRARARRARGAARVRAPAPAGA